ncbi:MAG: FKBP-type peptidyl-prolyl cis-trans isomerase SlyD [Phenylobacterium sp.]|jgi:FKBP-type peptidyl-prolyl cis-trans isomerase SlyD
MQVANKHVVQFNYVLKNDSGEELESSPADNPIAYLHGTNGIIKGLADAMEGKSGGEQFSITLEAKDAYGERNPDAEQRVPVKHLQGAKKWKKGMVAVVETGKGQRQVTIVKMGKFMATVDTNHPLSGKVLTFDIDIVDVRAATDDEVSHGHAHGVGGHQH